MRNGILEVGDTVVALADRPWLSRMRRGDLSLILSVSEDAVTAITSSGYINAREENFDGLIALSQSVTPIKRRYRRRNKTKAFVLR